MVFLNRLRQSKLKFSLFSNEFKRCYSLNHSPIVANQHISSRTLIPVLKTPNFISQGNQLDFFHKVRFYAAPVQANQKKEERDENTHKRNEQITDPLVRLVTDEGHYVISKYEALARAKSLQLDLVLVDRVAKPPVCKIFDYHKEKYLWQMKEKERSRSKCTIKKGCKEVRFAAKIKQKDLQIKAEMVKRLMESGYRVKCTAIDPTNDLDLETLLSRFFALIEDVAIEEGGPRVEKKQAYTVVRHIKFGPSKKGSGKKASNAALSSESSSKNTLLEENGETIEAGVETEQADSEELSDEDAQTKKSEWAVLDGDDDIHAVFDINGEDNGQPKNAKHDYFADRNPRNVVEFAPTNTASSIPLEVQKNTMQNRYARDPRAGKQPRNTMNSVPWIPNQGKQPQFSMNTPHQRRPTRQVEVPFEDRKQEESRSSIPNSTTKNFGIFSGQQGNATPHEQKIPAESNRYKKSDSYDSARSQRSTGFPPQRNAPPADFTVQRGPGSAGINNPRQGRWRVYNKDNSNVIPNKNENQAEVQRR